MAATGGMWAWCFCVNVATGVVLHPEGTPDANWPGEPLVNMVGRWINDASCVAVAPNYIITTRHQGGGNEESDRVFFSGIEYQIVQVWNEPSTDGAADLRVCRIATVSGEPANLTHYAAVYAATDEAQGEGLQVIIGGYGSERQATLLSGEPPQAYGYSWSTGVGNTDQSQRWGANRIQGSGILEESFLTDYLLADFDDLLEGDAAVYEAAPAEFDSGGGWFVQCGNQWKVVGLSLGVEHGAEKESWFRRMANPDVADPDDLFAVRISAYAQWIRSVAGEPACAKLLPGDFNGDCLINELDAAMFGAHWLREDCHEVNGYCQGADFYPTNGRVDLFDFGMLAIDWLDSAEPLLPCE